MQFRNINKRLVIAMSCYAILTLIATVVLDGLLRTVLWLYFLVLAAKTLAASQSED